ncbi:MAG: hypothetical protein KGJ13_10990 [Patescibacteria group bacterium]|nr:hypothetical protein [Patescibacteria group bacterium]
MTHKAVIIVGSLAAIYFIAKNKSAARATPAPAPAAGGGTIGQTVLNSAGVPLVNSIGQDISNAVGGLFSGGSSKPGTVAPAAPTNSATTTATSFT